MYNADFVIDSKSLIYEPYRQSRGDGFSGELLMATKANNPEKRYIIKAAMAHVAACEFMFYRLAAKLGLRVAPVHFVTTAKPKEFKYPACAVDFIPNAVELQYDEWSKIEECVILANLSYILGDRDNLDFLRDKSEAIYKIDHSDCFGIEDTAETWINPKKVTPSFIFYQMAKPTPRIGHYAEEDILQGMFERLSNLTVADFDDELALIEKFCGQQFAVHFRHYISELIAQSKTMK